MPGQIIPRGKGTWLVRVYQGSDPATGKRIYENRTIHGNKHDAEAYLAEALRRRDLAGTDIAGRRTLMGELFDDLLVSYRIAGQDYDWAEARVRLHLRPVFAGVQARRISTAMVKGYIDRRQQAGAANATINRELALLKRAFNLAREHTPPKVGQVPFIPMLDEDNVRKGFLEHYEYLALREALPGPMKPILAFGYYTGCRKGEILSLQWRQVDLLERIVRLEAGTTKNDEPRVIPLAPELYEMLAAQRVIRGQDCPACPWVFFHDGEPITPGELRGAWESACREAGLWNGDEETGKPAKLFHDLRRTGVRNLIRAGVPEAVAMRISGHKTRSVFDRYNIVSEADLKDAARRLSEYLQQKPQQEIPHTLRTQAETGPVQ
ncbi:MAG: site-specific integrase [Acidobacteriota bacterium]